MAIVFDEPEGQEKKRIVFEEPQSKQPRVKFDDDDTSLGRTAAGLGAEIAIGEAGRLGSAAAGAAIGTFIAGPFGTVIGGGLGYVIGGLSFGAAGSVARQRIQNPDAELDHGEVVADSLINLIPGFKAAKGTGFVARAGSAALRQGAVGAVIGVGAETIEVGIEEKRLPTLQELGERGITTAALAAGLGVSGEAVSKAYSKFAGLPSRKLSEAFKAGDPDAKILVDGVERRASEYRKEVSDMYEESALRIQEKYSDENIRVRVLQEETAGGQYKSKQGIFKVTKDEEDYYLQRRLAEAKVQAKNQQIAETIQLDNDFLATVARETGQEASSLSRTVDNYLHSRHAIAYNKKHGDGAAGITTKEAKSTIDKFKKHGLDETLRRSVVLRGAQAKSILNVLEEGGLVTPKLAKELRAEFPDYVPLNRIMDDDSMDDAIKHAVDAGGIRGEALGSGLKRAKGSEREVLPINQNIYTNYVDAVRRAEINKANIAFKKMVEANPNQSMARIRKPKVKGTKLVKDESPRAKALRAQGKKVPPVKQPILEESSNNVLTIFENGERYFAEIDDKNVMRAMKGLNKEQLGGIMRVAQKYNRFIGGLYTRWNPEFLIPNLFRDRSEAFVNNMSKMNFSEAVKTLAPNRVSSDMAIITKRLLDKNPSNAKELELFKLYDEFKKSGGSSGGLGLTTVKDVEKTITELAKNIDSPMRRKARALNELVSGINEVVEDATRFGTFRQAIASGMTKDQAALAARNSSFDPLLGGSEADFLRAAYLFANPALQGAKNFLRSMRKPKVAMGVMGGLTALTYSLDQWNQMQDPEWRAKLKAGDGSNWKTNKNLIIITGKNEDGSLKYVSIPIGYSMTPFKVIADTTQRFASGQDVGSPDKLAAEVGQEIIDSYNPMGGSPIPTILRPLHELATNKDGLGRDIRPDWLEQRTMSATERVYPWTARTQGGEVAMALTDTLKDMGYETSPENLLYLYQTWFGGPGNTVKRLFNVASKLSSGKELKDNEIPIARRFYGETYEEAWEIRNGEMATIEKLEKQEGTESARTSRVATNIVQDVMEGKTPEERRAILRARVVGNEEVNPVVERKILERLKREALGITYTDSARKRLGVQNMARAKSYVETIEKLDVQNIATYLQEQREKKILTPEVERQINLMIQGKQFFDQQK